MIKGLDVYHNSPSLDYNQLKKDGFGFIIIKATEGKTFVDPKFKDNVTSAKAATILTGAYGFSRPGSSKPEDEAQALLKQIQEVGGVDLPPMLDMEDNGGLSDSDLCNFVTKWRETIQKVDKRKPILYLDIEFYNKLSSIVKDFIVYIAEYGVKEPRIKDYQFWQYTNSEIIQGGKFDGDYFNGSLEDLKALCQQVEQVASPRPHVEKKESPKAANKSSRISYQIKSGDTLTKIALNNHIPLQVLARYNNIENPDIIQTGKDLRIPQIVQVRSGDTISEYARANNESVSFLGYVNSLENVSKIYVGQTLYV